MDYALFGLLLSGRVTDSGSVCIVAISLMFSLRRPSEDKRLAVLCLKLSSNNVSVFVWGFAFRESRAVSGWCSIWRLLLCLDAAVSLPCCAVPV